MRAAAALLLTAQGLAAAWQPSALATETGRLPLPPARAPADRADVSVDFSDPAGRAFDFQYGVDHGPECDAPCLKWSPDNKGCAVSGPVVNVAPELLAMGASLIRTHDSGVLDWPVVFPHSLALQTASSATPDTADPANYNWTQADEYYGRIIESGLEPYFRLGTSWGQLQGGLPPVSVAYNRTALVDVLLHTVMHYNEGWGGGRNFSNFGRTKFFEIWNEPDSSCDYAKGVAGCGRFWNRTAAEFYNLVDQTVRAVKGYDPTLQVGSDGVASPMTPSSTVGHPHPDGFIVWTSTDIECSSVKGQCNLGESSVVTSVHECEVRCNGTDGCTAFVITMGTGGDGSSDGLTHCQLKSVTGPGTGGVRQATTYVRVFSRGTNPYCKYAVFKPTASFTRANPHCVFYKTKACAALQPGV